MAIFEIPLLCPLKPVNQIDYLPSSTSNDAISGLPPQYNNRDIDEDFFLRTLKWYEDKIGYVQKYQQSDTIRLQWLGDDTTLANYQYARILDNYGKVVTSKTITVVQESGTWSGKKLYTATIYLYDLNEGYYFIQLRHKSGSEYLPILFEPIWVKQIHEKTARIDYYNTTNDWDTIFTHSSSFIFQLRVEGSVSEITPKATAHTYEDQTLDYEMLSGIPFREYEASFINITNWMADKINRATLCNTVYIDGKGLTRLGDSEPKKSNKTPLSDFSMMFRERTNTSTFDKSHDVYIVGSMPQTSYFWVEQMSFDGIATNVRKMFKGKRNFLDYLNSQVLTSGGYWDESPTNKLIYVGTPTAVPTLASTDVLAYCIKWVCSGSGNLAVDFTKGAIAGATYFATYYDDLTTGQNKTVYTALTHSKTFTTETTRTAYWFFSDVKEIADYHITCTIDSIGGDLAPSLTKFEFYNAIGIKRIENDMFKYCTGLLIFGVQTQQLDSYSVTDIIRWLYEHKNILSSSTEVYLDDNTPSAPPITSDQAVAIWNGELKKLLSVYQTD